MFTNKQQNVTPAQRPELVNVLIYFGITLAVGRAALLLSGVLALPTLLHNILVCHVDACLYRRFVFRSKKKVLLHTIVLLLAESFVYSIFIRLYVYFLFSHIVSYYIVSFTLSLICNGLSYLILRNWLYAVKSDAPAENTDTPAETTDAPSGHSAPDTAEQPGRIITGSVNTDSPRRSQRKKLFRRIDLDNSEERVIAQSSRDAIRAMEHKDLNIRHESHCEDRRP